VGLERRLTAYLPGMLERLFSALSAKKVLLGDLPPDLRSRWVSKDGKMRVEVHPADDITGNRAMRRFAGAVQSVVPDATGVPIIVIEAGEAVVSAFREASLIALVLIAAILMIVLRRIVDIFLVLAPLLLAGVLTAAVMVLFGLQFNFANIIILPLLLGLGVSSGIHLVLRQREEKESARVFASSTPGGVLFSGLTTIAAFGSLTLSGHRGMMSMGLLLAIAISITLIATLVVLPSLMALAASLSGKGKERP
jgi:predicted RND superfamily exporter protein